jgi:hypothetical protein
MHEPQEPNLALVKCILCYIKGTLCANLHIGTGPVAVSHSILDADWVGCPDSLHSTTSYCVYLGDNLVSWLSKHQTTLCRSSAEAKYHAITHAVA